MSHTPLFTSAVFVLLVNENDEVLLQRRSNTGYMDDHYDISATGHVEPNENLIDSAIRETAEEVGVTVLERDLKFVLATQMNVDVPYLNYVFICKVWKGNPHIMEPEKCDELSWFKKTELPKKLTPTLQLLKDRSFDETVSFEYVDYDRHEKMMGQ